MELKSPLEAATTKKKTYYLIDKNKKEYAFDYFNSISFRNYLKEVFEVYYEFG